MALLVIHLRHEPHDPSVENGSRFVISFSWCNCIVFYIVLRPPAYCKCNRK